MIRLFLIIAAFLFLKIPAPSFVHNYIQKLMKCMATSRAAGAKLYRWLFCDKIGQALSLFFSYTVLFCYLSFVVFSSELAVRTVGGLFQLFGMALAINGLIKIWTHFEEKSLKKVFRDWLKQFPLIKRDSIGVMSGSSTFSLSASARGYQWIEYNDNDELEERISVIARNIDLLKNWCLNHGTSIDDLFKTVRKVEKETKDSIERTEEKISNKRKSLHTDDLLTSLVGLLWISIGIVLSTWSQELHQLFNF